MTTVLCACGCGNPAPIAKQTWTRLGVKKGEPHRYIAGHSRRKHPMGYDVTNSGCWEWRGATNAQGYGIDGTRKHGTHLAHRIAYAESNGAIPAGMCVLHRCDNPPCVNPDHLFLGTRSDNMADKMAKGRHRGPTWDPQDSPGAKLTWEDVRRIRASDKSSADLASEFGVTRVNINRIRRGETWKERAA